ncbi:UDP-N-acetylmuramyl pentapeptide phosphotransferase/UDP-N-acetylglucosamine-1-phosphate transferase [Pedobacter cryoconitis]|uniref:UDP-N-acetylmuramyl pentapeptide phosphotransferase/UDP-N-acetylglucosamine-1-phosphate transferase n=1 Tax=Pedobacter cryoconitis TaxID=188932 RepID=A0A7W8YVJ0_9SPHI|nr:UDP-GlcNAc--UDP-phosphate GlcNAc-1-phosphate transferase [Pedobacter cryoconitis]MBB5622320.1 UDP-N-acetylmuramyl pentapeptide phosphotransferase/UDP-N-acetylglucosamine-1-phosphate transferase [Pedobacter cryoconitis]
MNITLIISIFIFLVLLELLYFKVADHFNIIDQPNHRSSHTKVTLRGGGIIFAISLILYPVYFGAIYQYFLIGLATISLISFIDDIKPVTNRLRIVFHLVGVACMFYQLGLFNLPFYWIILALILVIGCINAINFMDGINGITGGYALIILISLCYINSYIIEFTALHFLITSIISVVVFNFFNFRKRAKCFAGDVGSVSIAFIIMFFLLQLIIKTENFNYLLLLLVYGLDAVTTILFRLIRKENIFDAHRSHFYQYWANEKKKSHLLVSLIYSVVQLIMNVVILYFMPQSIFFLISFLVLSTVIFVGIRFLTEGPAKLLGLSQHAESPL